MTKETMQAIYNMAKSVYIGEMRLVDAERFLYDMLNVNKNSFADYYRALKTMLDGKVHRRSISTELRDYYLSKIHEEFGLDKLAIALKAYMDSIIYYEESHNTSRKKERDIHQKYSKLIKLSSKAVQFQNNED